jgi:hypothetical protein
VFGFAFDIGSSKQQQNQMQKQQQTQDPSPPASPLAQDDKLITLA